MAKDAHAALQRVTRLNFIIFYRLPTPEGERDSSREEVKGLQDEIAELRERIGRAEGELSYRRYLDENRKNGAE